MRLPQLRAAEVLRLLEQLGYERIGSSGGHIKMRRKGVAKPDDIVIVPMHKGSLGTFGLRSAAPVGFLM